MSTDQAEISPRLLKSSAVVGTMTMLSRVLGLVRDMVFARYIGADANADTFYIAWRVPNFLRRLFAEGAFAQAFVPVLSEYRKNGPHAAVQQLVNYVAGCLGSTLLVLTVFVVIGAPVMTIAIAPGFFSDAQKLQQTSDLLRITFPYLFLISMTGLAGAVLNSYGRFAVPAFTPVFLNIVLIFAAVIASPRFEQPVVALAWGVLIAGVVQLVFQMPFLMKLQLMPVPAVNWKDPGVRRILKLMAPAMFGVSVSQINLLLDTWLASWLQEGSISWLYYSDRLSELPLGVIGIAIATVIIPTLSRQHVSKDTLQFSKTLGWALRTVFLLGLPAALALVILAEPILLTLFEGGALKVEDAVMASYSLKAYAVGIVAFMLIKVLAPGYYSRQDTKTPVRIGIIAMVANMGMNIAFVLPLMAFGLGHMGLALATSLAAFLNAGLLYRGLLKEKAYVPQKGLAKFWLQLGFANFAMVACLLAFINLWPQWAEWDAWQRTLKLSVVCIAGFSVYLSALWLSGLRPRDFQSPH